MSAMHQLTPDLSRDLAAKLASRQGDRSDEEFATLLGITRTHWSYIRAGKRRITYALLKRAAALFPELYPIVLRDLSAEVA